jgi:hypothetical protein
MTDIWRLLTSYPYACYQILWKALEQRLCTRTYSRSANTVVIELRAAVAAYESLRPLHSVSFFYNISPIFVIAVGQTQVAHSRSQPNRDEDIPL